MEFKKLANRSVRVGVVLLFCCITFSQMTALSAAADSEEDVCTGADMGSYARLAFCLPPQVVVEPEVMAEADYAGGREVGASMLLDGARVGIHLLYPCQPPQKELESAELKPYLEAYNPIMTQAEYNDSETGPVLWGQVANQIFVAYQPNNLTVVLLLMDMNMSEEIVTNFLGNLSIDPNEGTTPLTPGYCTDTTVVSDEVSAISTEATEAPVEETAVDNPALSEPPAEKPTLEETVKDNAEARKEKMEADRAAAMAKLEEARARR